MQCLSARTSSAAAVGTTKRCLAARPCKFYVSKRQVQNLTTAQAAASSTEKWSANIHVAAEDNNPNLPLYIHKEAVEALEAELDQRESVKALRRFNDNLRKLPADKWESVLRPVFNELCYNLESFNPAFTACMLQVQKTLGRSDYVHRDVCLKNLIQPLAGEYGMHNGQPQQKTHRELFSDFFKSVFGYPLEDLVLNSPRPEAAEKLFAKMLSDITTGGSTFKDPMEQASYALGYNLAIEYLADYEKTWMLDSFRDLDSRVFKGLGKNVDWLFLEVHAEGEAEHAAIGHGAVVSFVPARHAKILRRAMLDHDRDFSAFYNRLADMLEC